MNARHGYPKLELAPGEPCVQFRLTRNSHGTATIKPDRIARVLKRDVVLESGDRFNKNRLSISHGTWESSTELLHPGDPRVVKAAQANAEEAVLRRVGSLIDKALLAVRKRDLTEAVELCKSVVERYGS